MADQEPTNAERALAQALAALARAYDDAAQAVESIPDPQQAFEASSELAARLRDTYEEATELRAEMVVRIWEAEELSLAVLAQRIGVSKARADQLIRAARAAKTTKESQ